MTIPWALRAAMAVLLALAALGAPTASVLACSCASLADGPANFARSAVANGGVAFVGTVVATRPAPPDPNGFGEVVAYAFEVERATATVPATIEVRALNDPGGASCGFIFGVDEDWFVTAYPDAAGALETGLCNNNQRAGDIDDAAMNDLVAVLAEVPVPGGGATAPAFDAGALLPIAAVLAVVLLLGGVMVVAFRRGDVS